MIWPPILDISDPQFDYKEFFSAFSYWFHQYDTLNKSYLKAYLKFFDLNLDEKKIDNLWNLIVEVEHLHNN